MRGNIGKVVTLYIKQKGSATYYRMKECHKSLIDYAIKLMTFAASNSVIVLYRGRRHLTWKR